MKASINSIESLGAVDGPGIRTVVFFNQCLLRCKYCHNPEMWKMQDENHTPEELVTKVKRYKPYFKNNGGVTFSGGEPLLQSKFLIETCKLLKNENIHIAIDTAGYGTGNYEAILANVDLIIFDIKDTREEGFKELTGGNITRVWEFLSIARKMHKKFWIRQVVVPGIHDNQEYIKSLVDYLNEHFEISDIERIEFLPYHKLGSEKYEKLKIKNPYQELPAMDELKCAKLYNQFMNMFEK